MIMLLQGQYSSYILLNFLGWIAFIIANYRTIVFLFIYRVRSHSYAFHTKSQLHLAFSGGYTVHSAISRSFSAILLT